ncbi:MAG TPA: type VI secretion system ATPase TssH [Planctomycetota bacterium]|nr:type VI secretion system ATPase TssH [Planctomycetota bacterium]
MTDIKPLIERLNASCKAALNTAAGQAMARQHYEITVEHLFAVMLDDANGDLPILCKQYGVEVPRLVKALASELEGFKSGNTGRPVFSPRLVEWFEAAWLVASLNFGHADIRSGVLLIGLLDKTERLAGGDWHQLLAVIDEAELKKRLDTLVVESKEQTSFASASAPKTGKGAAGPSGGGALDKFCINFTKRVRDGKIDPVFGRDNEIRQIVDILARRRKNNPICVGEPGVGKTAVVEGLALRVVEGDVPDSLKGVEIIGLDLGLLQAGASVKGEFENRLKAVLDEIKSSPKPIILFIDEAHTLIGAGGAAGTGDAANMMKPELARGELKTIAATTWAEYKKYFERDAALARRFQVVKLDEPSVEVTTTMLRGLRANYEKSHNVVIRDEALIAAAEMGSRYIAGRQNPDKGIDLIDTAAARVKVALSAKPAALQDAERRIQDIDRTLDALRREEAAGADVTESRADFDKELAGCKARVTLLGERWKAEKILADAVVAARTKLNAADKAPADEQAKLKATLKAANDELTKVQAGDPLIHVEVNRDVIARVVADWTGVPVGNMVKDEAKTLLNLEALLKRRIKGQDHVMDVVAKGIRSSKAGLKSPGQPMGIFLFVGPSGVGKTETATAIADQLFGGERFMTAINMSEFQEKHTVSRLVGSPPGYVGYGEGGVLTEAVRQRPYSVVLLDEVEKADLDVMNLFYQVFDKGTLSDGEGRTIDFKNTCMFLTSNLATDLITEYCTTTKAPNIDELVTLIRPALSRHFKPALLARMTIVPFFNISAEALRDITLLKLNRLAERLETSHKMQFGIQAKAIEAIVNRCTEVEAGARNIDHIISGTMLPKMSEEILRRMGDEGGLPGRIEVGLAEDGSFAFNFTEAIANG